MGLFSGEDVYQFEVATAKMVNTDVDPIKDAVLTAILVEEDIPAMILVTMLNSLGIKARRYLRYGQDHYIYGLPESSTSGSSIDHEALDAAITSEQGEPVTVLSGFASAPNITYHAYAALQEAYDWRLNTNELLITGLAFEVVRVTHDGSNYAPPQNILIEITTVDPINPEGDHFDFTLRIDYPKKAIYYYGVFYLDSETSNDIQYWAYDPDDGTYPDLVIVPSEFDGTFYPIAPIRVDKEWVEDDPEEDDEAIDPWETTRKLLKKVTLNIPDIREAIEEEQDDDDIENLNDIFFLFAVDIYTEEEKTYEYLYNFFDILYGAATVPKAQYVAERLNIAASGNPPSANTFTVSEEQLTAVLEYNFITKEIHNGQLETEYEKEITYVRETEYDVVTSVIDPITNFPVDEVRTFTEQNSTVVLRHDNGDGTYTELYMHGPKHISQVQALGKRVRIYRKIDHEFIRPDDTPKEDWDKYGQSGFYLPVDFTVMAELSLRNQMYALMDSMLLVVHAAAKEHLEWYESGIFRALLQFVMLVINVVLFIPTLGSNLTLSAALWKIFVALVLPRLTSFILEYLVKAFGKDAILIVIAAYYAFSLFKGLASSLKGLPNALDLLKVTNALNGGMNVYSQVNAIDRQLEFDELTKIEEELSEAEKDLEQGMDPFLITNALQYVDTKEQPEDYYNRTIHLGNPGVLSLKMIGSFHERALALPKVGEVGESIII